MFGNRTLLKEHGKMKPEATFVVLALYTGATLDAARVGNRRLEDVAPVF